jgi:hypothetical protein
MLQSLLLLFVAIAGPWVVHLAPIRMRLMALAGFAAVLVLWLAFESWIGKWWFWVGLLIGIATVMFVGGGDTRDRRPPPPRSRRPRPTDMTEEIGPPVSR